ncbi:hypothetical protein WISP_76309 [Willisornis vidua]|uniref:Uncharacterized protein n=1 Tax=Willisornis vidua TaxID=1566151 RepID=A0ABQ9D6M7_9PASS|nr:hypothetical protein WISP_76309 [Willisornis vidua]
MQRLETETRQSSLNMEGGVGECLTYVEWKDYYKQWVYKDEGLMKLLEADIQQEWDLGLRNGLAYGDC